MPVSPRDRVIVWACVILAVLVNIAGYLWNLYERFAWFDEVLHAYTTFALILPLALLLYNVVLTGEKTHPILFVLMVTSLGISIGVLWEIAEWGYDQRVPANVILGKTDTIIDLMMDILGGVAAGIVSLGMLNTKQ